MTIALKSLIFHVFQIFTAAFKFVADVKSFGFKTNNNEQSIELLKMHYFA